MTFKEIYSMARKVPHLEGLSTREIALYRNAFRNGYRAGSAAEQKVQKVIVKYQHDIPPGPIINNQQIVETIFDKVIEYYQVQRSELIGKCRDQYLVIPRSMIANLMRECTALTYPEIARILNKDHTSVLHYVKTRLTKSSFWKEPNNHKIYSEIKGKVLRETS